MFQVSEDILQKILKRKFNNAVGVLCERIENLSKTGLSKDDLIKQIKFDLKKDLYNTMREIEEQLSSFSEGTIINVSLTKPISKE